jgi:hypothetical protein
LTVVLDDYVRTQAAAQGGKIRIDLSEIPDGRYRICLTYIEKDTGADFRLWQRQSAITSWISSRGEDVVREKCHLGEMCLTPQTASLTIEVRNGGFDFQCLYLEKL